MQGEKVHQTGESTFTSLVAVCFKPHIFRKDI